MRAVEEQYCDDHDFFLELLEEYFLIQIPLT